MSGKNSKQFGVWMDAHHATIIGKEYVNEGEFVVKGKITNNESIGNSNENAANNHEKALAQKFFKDISALMQNAEEIHITGTGTSQEQFIKYLAETPQFRNTITTESTSNKMSEEQLVSLIKEKLN